MHFEEVQTAVMRYFGDMSRPAAQTRAGLLALASECQSLAGTLLNEGIQQLPARESSAISLLPAAGQQ